MPRLFIILFLVYTSAQADNIKSIIKYFEKGEWKKTEEQILKTIEKENFSPGAYYYYSRLFVEDKFKRYSRDSAYYYINKALAEMDSISEREKDKLYRQGVTFDTLAVQKKYVEELAYAAVVEKNRVEDYNHFLQTYSSSLFVAEVTFLRNKKAFENAAKIDTYRAYLEYMRTYPEAEYYEEAKRRYERLLYESRTRDKKLASYIKFIEDYPETYYREEVTRNIFEVLTSSGKPSDYLQFINTFPATEAAKDAIDRLYHVCLEKDSIGLFYSDEQIPKAYFDSVQVLERINAFPLHAFHDGEHFIFMYPGLKDKLAVVADSIPPNYLCKSISTDLLLVKQKNQTLLQNRIGDVVYSGGLLSYEDLGYGWIKIEQNEGYLVLHKSGKELTGQRFEDIQLLDGYLFKFKEKGKWGLISNTNRPLLKAQFDDIHTADSFIIFRKGDKIGISNPQEILQAADLEKIKIQTPYDDFELIKPGYMLAFNGEKEIILDREMHVPITLKGESIYPLWQYWYVVGKKGQYSVLQNDFTPFNKDPYEKLFFNDRYVAVRDSSYWNLISADSLKIIHYGLDSILLLDKHFVVESDGDSLWVYLNDTTIVTLSADEKVALLNTEENEGAFLAIRNNKSIRVIDSAGSLLFEAAVKSVNYFGDSLFRVESGNYQGLVNCKGDEIISPKYQLISGAEHQFLILVNRQQFGLYHKQSQDLVFPKFDTKPVIVNDSLFYAGKNGKLLLFNIREPKNEIRSFEQAVIINDTVMALKDNVSWSIFTIAADSILLEGLDNITPLFEGYWLLEKANLFGVYRSDEGLIVPIGLNRIDVLANGGQPLFKSQVYIEPAKTYLAIIYDSHGEILYKQIVEQSDFDKFFCLN